MRRTVYAAAAALGVNHLARALFRSRLLVVCMHGVCGDAPDVPDPEGMHIPAAVFDEQLDFFVRHYQPVSLDDVRRAFLDGSALPDRAVLLTFDDGYRNVLRNAVPRLRAKQVPYALFPVPGAVDDRRWLWAAELEWRRANDPGLAAFKRELKNAPAAERRQVLEAEFEGDSSYPDCDNTLLDWDELRGLARDPLATVGSHGLRHDPLTTYDEPEMSADLRDSRLRLCDELSMDVDTLAYPNGSVSDTVARVARECGYRLAFTTAARHARVGDDPLLVPRLLVGARDRGPVLAARLAGWQEWLRSAPT